MFGPPFWNGDDAVRTLPERQVNGSGG